VNKKSKQEPKNASRNILVITRGDQPGRWVLKYRDPAETDHKKRWKKVRGGALPPTIKTKEEALAYGEDWFRKEMNRREASRVIRKVPTFAEMCELYCKEVSQSRRLSGASVDDYIKRARFLARDPMLSDVPLAEHDGRLAVRWVRRMLSEPREKSGEPLDPITVRNYKSVLTQIYELVRELGHLPDGRMLPTDHREVAAELSAAISRKQEQGPTRFQVPPEYLAQLVLAPSTSAFRRITMLTYVYTGLRPGELHGLLVQDVRRVGDVLVLDIRVQRALYRSRKLPERKDRVKTPHSVRRVPAHRQLARGLDWWLKTGWEAHVGRPPTPTDYLFPNPKGKPFREPNAEEFRGDLKAAGCETEVRGQALVVYGIRHTFATLARRAGVASDVRDRLLGHSPKDTKAAHYEDEDMPLMAQELEKLPFLVPQDELERVTGTSAGPDQLPQSPTPPRATLTNLGEQSPLHSPDMVQVMVHPEWTMTGPAQQPSMKSAEEVGFEPTDPVKDRRFSKSSRAVLGAAWCR
jgi:integrase